MSSNRRHSIRSSPARPTHPKIPGLVLALAVVILILGLASISTFGAH